MSLKKQEIKKGQYADVGQETGCPKLVDSDPQRIFAGCEKVRILTVLGDPASLLKIGPAAPLLALIIQKCGNGDDCDLKYRDVATALGIGTTTVKMWANRLDQEGYVSREPCGPTGVRFQIQTENWPTPAMDTRLADAQDRLITLLTGVKSTMVSALDFAITNVQNLQRGAA